VKIGLFGGSFNPPHVGHVLLASWAASTRDLDRIWFVPTYRHAFGKSLVDFELRCRMVELSIEPFADWAELSRVEAELGTESRTIDTVRHLMRVRPDDVFHLVIGADILLEAHKWKQFDRLRQLAPFHVAGRRGYTVPDREFALELPEVSSTEIRAALASGDLDFCRDRVPRKVLDFIVEQQLYRQLDESET
jgi:nicotinate-nucleotide adenylyltransferase